MNNLYKRVLSSIILFPLALYCMLKGSFYLTFLIFICFLIALFEWYNMVKKNIYKFFGFIFLITSFYTFYKLSITLSVIIPFLICISTDIGGYVFGNFFKGPKLTKISPNKTYSGMIGGYLLSIVFISLYFDFIDKLFTLNIFILVIIISSVSQIGDIIISYFKRLSKLKNTGNIIPGHGGLLDRIDGMIFAFPAFYLLNLTSHTF